MIERGLSYCKPRGRSERDVAETWRRPAREAGRSTRHPLRRRYFFIGIRVDSGRGLAWAGSELFRTENRLLEHEGIVFQAGERSIQQEEPHRNDEQQRQRQSIPVVGEPQLERDQGPDHVGTRKHARQP